ncbi:laccase isoform X2 [Harpegnathos saltator]|nr:laccase isoform X2 [Harpegnathos saltator]
MCNLRRSIVLCVILIYCEVLSPITGNAIPAEVAIPADDAIPIAVDAASIEEDGTLVDDEFPFVDSSEDWYEDFISAEDSAENTISQSSEIQRRSRIIGGVDDEREDIRGYCPIRVDPTPDHPNIYSPLECARTCNDEKPRICYYHFEVEYYSVLSKACDLCQPNATNAFCNNCECITADGVERTMISVNRMMPGPTIDVCEGDKIVVDVSNNIEGEELTIHWHGIFQKGSQYYDGAAHVTQCPIPEQTTFRYQFNADNAGTHFWHAHTGLQKLDGVFGRLIVRQSVKREVHRKLYDFDLSRHGIIISDWLHELAASRMPGRRLEEPPRYQDPDSILINGKGRYQGSNFTTNTNFEVFNVERDRRYRFRFVNNFCTVCTSMFTVEGHNLTIIAVDGISVKPTVVTSIVSVSGERYDFIINADDRVDSYWIQLRALSPCQERNIQQFAILQYDGASDQPSSPMPSFTSPLPEGVVLNPLDSQCDRSRNDAVCVSNLKSAQRVDRDIYTKRPDAQIYLPFKFYRYNIEDLFAPNSFDRFIVAPGGRHTLSYVDNIALRLPPSPPLSQLEDIPSDLICNSTSKPSNCEEPCICTHVIELPYNGIVELIIIDETGVPGLHHPFHLHGYAFNIMGVGVPNNGTGVTVEEIKRMDRRGLLRRRRSSVPFKDTIAVPNRGYAIVRFRADNPGYWLLHCHFIYHLATGMGNVFHVGGPSDVPPVPQDFPRCGNFLPKITQHHSSV